MPGDTLTIDFYRLHAFSPSVTVITFHSESCSKLSCWIESSRKFSENEVGEGKEVKRCGVKNAIGKICWNSILQFIKHCEKASHQADSISEASEH